MARKMIDSGVEWIGKIPEGWASIRFSNVLRKVSKRFDSSLPAGAISFGQVIVKAEDSLTDETKKTYQSVKNGEFLINPINLNYDLKSLRTSLSEINVCVSPAYIVAESKTENKKYIKWLLSSFDLLHMKTLGAGVRQTITFEDISKCSICLPPISDQQKIADFLDRETAIIDKRIALIRRKKELLSERRKSVIHEAVTKGLDRTAPMKDSGVEWIGKIPEGWKLRRMKNAGLFQTGKDFKHLPNGKIPVFGSSKDPFAYVSETICNKKALAIGRKGTIDSPYILPEGFWAVDTCMFNTVENPSFNFQFLSYWMNIIPWINISTKTALPSLTQTDANNALTALPPLQEQQKIADFLDHETSLIDRQIEALTKMEGLLAEQRKALIHEAVTGKLEIA